MPGVRPLQKDDIPQVANLVWKVLHERKESAPTSLQEHLDELFLQNPWMQDDIFSRVYEDAQGKVVGFFGVLPRKMCLRGNPVRLAFGSNFVFDPESRVSMGAIQLVRGFMKGPQDISITDSANENSRQILRSLGFNVVPTYSMLWARPLRPSLYALDGAARLKKKGAIVKVAALAKPFCGVADMVATNVGASPFHQAALDTTSDELSTETLLQCLSTIPGKQFLLPDYDAAAMNWVLSFIERRKAYGTLRKSSVRNAEGKIIGWYVYGATPGAIGEVLQLGAESASSGKVLDHLFHDAFEQGLIGLHGRLEPQFMSEMTQRACFFLRKGSWTLVHSSKPELLEPLYCGNAFFSRLEGEGCLRYGRSRA
jgi:hypothetical protein